MATFEVERPESGGLRVTCPEHSESTEFPPRRGRVTFYCSGCDLELDVRVSDASDWRDWYEMC